MGFIIKTGAVDLVSFGGRSIPWRSSYKVLIAQATTTTTIRATFRDQGATSGFVSPANGFRVIGFRVIAQNGASGAIVNGGISRSDNDVGFASSTPFTNEVTISPSASYGVVLPGGVSGDASTHLGAGYTVAVGKYLGCHVSGGTSLVVTMEALIEIL